MNGFNIIPFTSFLVLIFLISGRIIFLKRNGIAVSSSSGKASNIKVFLYPFFLLILLLWFFELAKPVIQVSFSVLPEWITNILINSLFLKITGVLIITVSLIFLTLTLQHFKNSLRFGLDKNNHGELISHGVFAFSRNPFFLSLDLYFIGIAFVLPNLFFIGFAVLTLVSIHFFVLKEEKFMLKVYGEEYEDYTKKVRRYF